ncbi:hypothetical protein [Bradyrhizobium sp. YR681]|uniref:hypothetical protein n=1 Tax=Bradyrhizobium sp. YR681 TaxID=1144344 RepID=UPI0012F6214F|nr:hypothetical protein [Bradyrhizobium sp. YR681]
MAEDPSIRRKRSSASLNPQRERLASELHQIVNHLAISDYFGRLVCVALLLAVGAHGIADDRFRISVLLSATLVCGTWAIDKVRQRNRLNRLTYRIDALDENSVSKDWEERSIRYEYHLRYSIEERVLGAIQNGEPIFWGLAVLSLSFFSKILA